jgi:hypothetical protein
MGLGTLRATVAQASGLLGRLGRPGRLRYCIVLLFLAIIAQGAEPARDAAAVITSLTAALTAGNVQEFLAPFDPAVAGYDRLRVGVAALAAQGETQSFVEVTKNEGSDHVRTVEANWELRIRREGDATPSSRREVHVVCKLELRGKRWRIMEFTPVDFLVP